MTTVFTTPFAKLTLNRYPQDSHPSLQAFDAADEYLLNELSKQSPAKQSKLLIINDNFGALATSLATHYPIDSYGDSHLAELALYHNLKANQIAQNKVNFIPSTEPLKQTYDVVLIRVPKTLALLEEQLIELQKHIHADSLILTAAMVKHLPKTASGLLEKYLGTVQASLAVKKARILRITPQAKPHATSPYPTHYTINEFALQVINHANVFSREGLDIGTRAFLPHLPKGLGKISVADLGCGNGILAIICAIHNLQAELTLVDESYMAIASAKTNWQQIIGNREACITVADGLTSYLNQFDLILCNPPFHQQQVIGDFIAKQMFKQAKQALKTGGELWIVANRHLSYGPLLKRLFKEVKVVTQTPKFIIWRAIK